MARKRKTTRRRQSNQVARGDFVPFPTTSVMKKQSRADYIPFPDSARTEILPDTRTRQH